jgi:hypothetical protein
MRVDGDVEGISCGDGHERGTIELATGMATARIVALDQTR